MLFTLLLCHPRVHSSLLSIQLSSSSTNSRYWHWHTNKRLTSLILIITLTHWVMPPDFFFFFFALLFFSPSFLNLHNNSNLALNVANSLHVSASKEQGLKVSNIKLNIFSSLELTFCVFDLKTGVFACNTCLYTSKKRQRLDYWQPAQIVFPPLIRLALWAMSFLLFINAGLAFDWLLCAVMSNLSLKSVH